MKAETDECRQDLIMTTSPNCNKRRILDVKATVGLNVCVKEDSQGTGSTKALKLEVDEGKRKINQRVKKEQTSPIIKCKQQTLDFHSVKKDLNERSTVSVVQHSDKTFRDKISYQKWKTLRRENLNVDHTMLYFRSEADILLKRCEAELSYDSAEASKICIFGKWLDIPRKQVAHGDEGLTYTFSGNTVPAKPWTPLLTEIKDNISRATGYKYNFVLINRYKDGNDYMGEHKDDEKDLDFGHPIASLSLGQARDFVFKHQDTRNKKKGTTPCRTIDNVAVELQHGMLLMMNHPTNSFWYHSLPKRTKAVGLRINMTFRKMNPGKCKPLPVK